MNFPHRNTMLFAVVLATALGAAGCDQRAPSATVGQKIDSGTDRVAAATDDMANRTGTVVGDAAITAKVKAAMVAEPGLRSPQIDVDTKDSVVTLSGTVASASLHDRAMQIASSVSGVKSVQDKLVTKEPQSG